MLVVPHSLQRILRLAPPGQIIRATRPGAPGRAYAQTARRPGPQRPRPFCIGSNCQRTSAPASRNREPNGSIRILVYMRPHVKGLFWATAKKIFPGPKCRTIRRFLTSCRPNVDKKHLRQVRKLAKMAIHRKSGKHHPPFVRLSHARSIYRPPHPAADFDCGPGDWLDRRS